MQKNLEIICKIEQNPLILSNYSTLSIYIYKHVKMQFDM